MKLIFIFFISFVLNNCSLNNDSKYWKKNSSTKDIDEKKIFKSANKTEDVTKMTFKEYEIYIDDYTKKSNYPDISK